MGINWIKRMGSYVKKKREKCDLLEVYNDMDKEKLIKNIKRKF